MRSLLHARARVALPLAQVVIVRSVKTSPVVTTAINLLNAARWRQAGHSPTIVLGHSIGEVAAACTAGMLTIDDAILTAHLLGQVGSQLSGGMVHTRLSRDQVEVSSNYN